MSTPVATESTATHLGGTVPGPLIHKIGLGLMLLSAYRATPFFLPSLTFAPLAFTPKPVSDEQAFEALKTAIDLTPKDRKLFINSADFYGFNPRTANLELIARFFTKYPELADRVFLSVKVPPSSLFSYES